MEPTFPVDLGQLHEALLAVLKSRKADRAEDIIKCSVPKVVYLGKSTYGGGLRESWKLVFGLPTGLYAEVEEDQRELQEYLSKPIHQLLGGTNGHSVDEIALVPDFQDVTLVEHRRIQEADPGKVYAEGKFRLFLSHLSTDKVFLSQLKGELSLRGVSAFLAHEDIEPTKEWQDEIELALRTMQAMAVFLAEGFKASNWTDQEVGWALGRGVRIFPIKFDINPYGFMGKYQAMQARRESPGALADKIIDLLIQNGETHASLREALIHSFRMSPSYEDTHNLKKQLEKLGKFTDSEKQLLVSALKNNSQISDAWGLRDWIESVVGKANVPF